MSYSVILKAVFLRAFRDFPQYLLQMFGHSPEVGHASCCVISGALTATKLCSRRVKHLFCASSVGRSSGQFCGYVQEVPVRL